MQRFFFTLSLISFLTFGGVRAQTSGQGNPYTDSLKVLFGVARTDTAKATLLNELSDYWSTKDSAKAVSYASRSLQLSEGNPFYEAAAHFYLAGAYFYYDPVKSKEEYLKTVNLLKKDTSRRALILSSRSWANYGALLQRQDSAKAFLRIVLDHAIPLAKKAKDTLRIAINYASIGVAFSNILNYEKAILYYKKAIRLVEDQPNPPKKLATFYTRLAKNYLYNEQDTLAKPCLDKACKILSGLPDSFDHANYKMVLGMYYFQTQQWQPAYNSLDSAMSLAKKLDLPYLATGILFQKFKAFTGAKKYPQAKEVLLQVYHDSATVSRPGNRLMILYSLAQTEAAMGNMEKAYQRLLAYATLSDSLNQKKLKTEISALEIKYQSEKKQREILTLQNRNKQQALNLQQRRFFNYLLLGGVFILLLISLVVFILYQSRKKRAQQESELHQKQLNQIRQEQQLKVYNAMLEGQEQERRRMARDLHDGLGGMLAGVKLKLSEVAEDKKQNENMELYKVIHQLDHSVEELRRIARNMMPETLLRFGVETALNDLCDSLQTPSLPIDFQAYQLSSELPQPVQIAVYRIVQELLTNAVRYAEASAILVQCSQNEDRIYITVEDDGKGFDVNAIERKKGIGLANIKNRINYLNGKLDIQSTPEDGTTVNVEVNAYE